MLNACNKFNEKKDKDKNTRKYKDIIIRIQKLIKIRKEAGATTQINRVYSHTSDLSNNNKFISLERRKKLKKHHEEMVKKYGKETTAIIVKGNDMADELAELERKLEIYLFSIITPEHEEYVIIPEKNKKGFDLKSKIDT